MSRVCRLLVDRLSRLLKPDERDAVLGDILESGASGGAALRDLVGLVVRRQADLWTDWGPWVGLVGIVGPLAVMLLHFSLHLSRTFELYFWIGENYRHFDPAMLEETGLTLRHGIAILARHSFLLAVW